MADHCVLRKAQLFGEPLRPGKSGATRLADVGWDPIIRGWANYHRNQVADDVLGKVDHRKRCGGTLPDFCLTAAGRISATGSSICWLELSRLALEAFHAVLLIGDNLTGER